VTRPATPGVASDLPGVDPDLPGDAPDGAGAIPNRPGDAPGASGVPSADSLRVWDRPVRLLHGLLALSVAVAWCTDESRLAAHLAAGYAAAAVVAARLLWGVAGSATARFAGFVRRPAATWRYAREVWRGTEPRYLGHNPLGGWMAVALLGSVAATGATGWLYTTDAFWGLAWLDLLHRGLAWTVGGLVALHLAGVAFTSLRHRENLARAMVTGRKPRGGSPAADADRIGRAGGR
jgi:cytochrome b